VADFEKQGTKEEKKILVKTKKRSARRGQV
jgi:hypothetical protein